MAADDKYEEEEVQYCPICGSESAYFDVNSEEYKEKYYCTNCGCEYMYIGEYRDAGELLILKGEKRDWLKHLQENLSLPFEGVVIDSLEESVQEGDLVIVKKIEFEDKDYGVIASIELQKKKRWLFGKRKYSFPIADIEATDKKSKNYKILNDYSVWFANN